MSVLISPTTENCVKSPFRAICIFQLVDEAKSGQLLDRTEKLVQAGDANDPINFSVFVANGKNHSLGFHRLGVAVFELERSDDFCVETRDGFSCNERAFHVVPFLVDVGSLPYVAKYIRKSAVTRPV
jgi:hypothetical protein